MHYCHIAASCLQTYASVAFYTLHYGSISRGITRGQWGRNYLGAKSLWGRWNIAGAPNDCGGAKMSLLPEDLRFENGGVKLDSCPGRPL